MDRTEYLKIIQDAKRLDRKLFDLSSLENIDRLEGILDEFSREQGETVIGVPLVQPYGGPTDRYVALSERVYWQLRTSLTNGEIETVYPEVGVPYDKKRFDMRKEQIRDDVDPLKLSRIPEDVIKLMKSFKDTAKKVVVYQPPEWCHYN